MTQAEYNRRMARLKATEPPETIPATPDRRIWEQELLELIFGTTIEDLRPA